MMGWHSNYRGRSIGRILHVLEMYCESNHRLFENATVNEGKIIYCGSIVANYYWEWPTDIKSVPLKSLGNDDTPFLVFEHECKKPIINEDLLRRWERAQYLYRPFLDDPYILPSVNYAVQEIRKVLSLNEALAIQHVRDRLNGEWNDVTVSDDTMKSIQNTVKIQSAHVSTQASKQKFIDSWQHLAMCAIYEI